MKETQAKANEERLKSVRKIENEYFKTINSSSASLSFSIYEEITLFQWLVLREVFQIFPRAMIDKNSSERNFPQNFTMEFLNDDVDIKILYLVNHQ